MSNKVQHLRHSFSNDDDVSFLSNSLPKVNNTDDEVERFLKPLFSFLKFLGIAIRQDIGAPKFFKMMGWLVFFLSFSCNVGLWASELFENSRIFERMSTTSTTMSISLASDFLFKLLNHGALLKLASNNYQTGLMEIIRQLSFPGLKIRQKSIVALVIFLSVS